MVCLAVANFVVAAPDMRGHGASGTRGDIAYDGQLDDDISDLLVELRRQHPGAHFSLLGFSAGGGFALRVAAKLNSDFVRVVLLSPYLGYDAPSTRGREPRYPAHRRFNPSTSLPDCVVVRDCRQSVSPFRQAAKNLPRPNIRFG
jgi:alpha-beta hydrolase superfamily lysophospholipase